MAANETSADRSSRGRSTFWTLIVAAWIALAGYAVLYVAPMEKTMGIIQRIFYFHVPSFWTAFIAIGVTTYSCIAYIATRSPKWDWLSVSSGEVGVLFLTIGLITGPIWAKPVWGVWWAWDARTTSTFFLWAMYVTYLLLRTLLDEPGWRALLSAVFGVFACLVAPFVYFSIWWFRTQHPQPVIGDGGYLDPTMGKVLLFCWGATLALYVLVVRERYQLEELRAEVDGLRMEAERRGL